MENMLSSEGVVYRVPPRRPKIKLTIELVITRITFKEKVKTFWWAIRLEGSGQSLVGGRLGVTSMQAAVRAARHFTKQNYKIARTIQESFEKPDMTLEDWSNIMSH